MNRNMISIHLGSYTVPFYELKPLNIFMWEYRFLFYVHAIPLVQYMGGSVEQLRFCNELVATCQPERHCLSHFTCIYKTRYPTKSASMKIKEGPLIGIYIKRLVTSLWLLELWSHSGQPPAKWWNAHLELSPLKKIFNVNYIHRWYERGGILSCKGKHSCRNLTNIRYRYFQPYIWVPMMWL